MARVSVREKKVAGRRVSRGRRPIRRGGGRAVRAVVLACAALSVLVALDHLSSSGEIRPGVSVGGVALGGKTPEEAREALGSLAFSRGEVRMTGPGEGAAIPARRLDLRFDAETTVERAYAVGREGGIAERISDRAGSLLGFGVPAEVGYSRQGARVWLRNVAERETAEVRDASVGISGSDVTVTPSRRGYALDVPASLAALDEALRALRKETEMVGEVEQPRVDTAEANAAAGDVREAASAPIRLTSGGQAWSVPRSGITSSLEVVGGDGGLRVELDRDAMGKSLARAYAPLTVEPVEAGYAVEGSSVAVTPGKEGRRVEEEKLLDAVEDGLFRGVREYEVPVAVARPELTTAEAESMKPTEMLGSYRTDYSVVPDDGTRVENLGISSEAVSGTLLAPGETFSMLDHVAGLDYNDSKVIVGGKETTADGGGLCQVTSTLYNAANFAGLDVVERTPHSAQLPYIRPGMDATVWWGGPGTSDDLDMKFRNTTGGYLLLREYVAGDGHVYAEIWGKPDGTEVEMHSEPVYMDGTGSEWVTYQTVERDGEVVFDGELHRDAYEPLVDGRGEAIPPTDVPVAPVDP
ncbi:hypothetical protein GBA63_07110 [Rubrobacter tropicus]|uniref:YoaR-like putative peptidoglycan binding domain-containing protein n=1 Tax=Rubrobacter tropicus TaxID=2653851 RepID=A0A6G8Q7M7_9ACTN|nr:VanW family protein [Rubrobacter tropicus]QIN82442.1 hypothetical protein GBA63_07110 [Rubrobacter tropicus]